MTALEKWKNDFKEFINELSMPEDDYRGIMEYINEVPNEALEHQPCDDCISRQALKRKLQEHHDFFIHAYGGFSNMPQDDKSRVDEINNCIAMVVNEPTVTPKEKTGHCKDCKYFEYDSVAKVNGIPLIVAHEICSKWGDGCKTKEDGYCFLFEPQESEDKEVER